MAQCDYCGLAIHETTGPHDGSCALRLNADGRFVNLTTPEPTPYGPITTTGATWAYDRQMARRGTCIQSTTWGYPCPFDAQPDSDLCKMHDPVRKADRLAKAKLGRERRKAAIAARDKAIREMATDTITEREVARLLIGLTFRRVA